MNIQTVCIVGGGALGHVIAGWLSRRGIQVNILTRHPSCWAPELTITTPTETFAAHMSAVSDNPAEVIPGADVVLLTVPGTANADELTAIMPWLRKDCFVGGVFCSSGFFFEAIKILPAGTPLWGFQRVPFIARVNEYGRSARLLGGRPQLNLAVENVSQEEKEQFARWIGNVFDCQTQLMANYLEVSITNSNPILHTGRLYSMFANRDDSWRSDNNILFYEEWTVDAARLIIDMDAELFKLLALLPVTPGYLTPLLEYYESHDADSLKAKIASIPAFKGITSPMKRDERGWYPDYSSRYFTEDFGYSLRYIYELARRHNVATPAIDKVYQWGLTHINTNNAL